MIRSPVSLSLYYPVHQGNGFNMQASEQLKRTWRRSIRSTGGYWIGTAEWDGSEAEKLDIFTNGLLWDLREQAGAAVTWQGFLAEMELTYNGQAYRRSWAEVANRVKAVYSKIGSNLITNPSCESAVWDAVNTPSVRERSTAWSTQGSYSGHITADSIYDGVTIQASVTVTAGRAYQAQITVKIISGTWRFQVYDPATLATVDQAEQATAGQWVLYVNVGEDNQLTTLALNLYCASATGEVYADACVFQLAPTRAETSWVQDATSQAEYGIIENILSGAGMTDAGANAWALRTLYQSAYAKTKPPTSIKAEDKEKEKETKLRLTFLGYVFTLRNKYTWIRAENNASSIVSSVVGGAQFVTAGSIQTNTLQFGIEERDTYRAWDLIKDITDAGDASGNRWTCGVYSGRVLNYSQSSNEPVARLRNGALLDGNGGQMAGWLAEPGMVALDDLPVASDYPSGRAEDRSRTAWMNEVVFSLGDWLDGETGVQYLEGGL
jgi:hypothetical protein